MAICHVKELLICLGTSFVMLRMEFWVPVAPDIGQIQTGLQNVASDFVFPSAKMLDIN